MVSDAHDESDDRIDWDGWLFFFSRILRPPRSTRTDTLFPYTTLFRSSDMILSVFSIVGLLASRFSPTMERAADSAARPSMERLWRPGIERLLNARVIARSVICGSEGLTVAPDRKSTGLNSSP